MKRSPLTYSALLLALLLVGCQDSFTNFDQTSLDNATVETVAETDGKLRHAHMLPQATKVDVMGKGGGAGQMNLIFKVSALSVLERYEVLERFKTMERFRVMERFYYDASGK